MEVISLAGGSSYFTSPEPAVSAAVAALHNAKNEYGPTEGSLELRRSICRRYETYGLALPAERVLVTPGVKQALFNLFSVLLRDEDEVLIPTPAWFGFHELLRYSRGKLMELPTQAIDGYKLTPEMLRRSIRPKTRILLLTNPGNPTGRTYTREELEALLHVVNEYPDLYFVSDEIYDFVTYGQPVTPALCCEGAKAARTVILNGFSKSFAMSAWRIGYIIGSSDLIRKCTDFQAATLSGVNVFTQAGARAAMEKREQELPAMLEALTENRRIMQKGLDAIPHVHYYLPDGAYYFFPDLSYYLNRTSITGEQLKTTADLCRYLRTCYNLELAPGDSFGSPGHVRMSFAVEKHRLQDAMQRLRQGLMLLITA
ncbi:pyridoxal phosphate-dependent aminotransferase [Pontibacter mangrovi]|uniref:Aminotransferase n=1 Tax=Pontibacter mangrovi TaxID=2589816 RepID=A0A501WD19_9BACT|nr:aminotransferase class I/II-fold pyridoxal phosphate-dependent enzyme [Pontibacter mangrovi]TPE45984.1 aminotransferase class I/II-fold pyridoxal phosphate-dependent enzyme [Pontibacter mangrovi]